MSRWMRRIGSGCSVDVILAPRNMVMTRTWLWSERDLDGQQAVGMATAGQHAAELDGVGFDEWPAAAAAPGAAGGPG